MIYSKADRYIINPEKIKGFVDYLYIFTQKARMLETNLSFEYGLESKDKIIIQQRWSTKQNYEEFANNPEFKKELETLNQMSKRVDKLYDLEFER
ncbi:hypothetical protein MCANUF31_01368 [Mycoplasmopsis canis UF31]|uniref:hypothetical protein n=1 Tax=Mycoplasmopsis canis TaxID=29555 RepID=UPI00025ADC35|nr:hypothetical protein [Mycoplasmopsis canis]EIE40481.1 hypothetical protein MCANUF31_01368 [Mycoplasmopsis canis UF31]